MPPKLRKRPANDKQQSTKKSKNSPQSSLHFEFGTSRRANCQKSILMPAPLNLHSRELFVGYFLRSDQGKFDKMYVDTKNNAFLVPEVSMLNFQRLNLMNKWFNCAVRSYFRYLQYHFSITSRPFEKFEFKDTNRMFYDSFNNTPCPPLDKHNSVVVFFNGRLIHVFKEANFAQLKRQKFFRNKAYSLTFDGSDSTRLSPKLNLFTELKKLNFQTSSDDMSGIFQRILNESFTSLKELTFYHQKFMGKVNDNTAFPPNLNFLQYSTSSSTIMDFNANSYKKLFNVEVPELTVGFELLLRLNKLSTEPILLNPKIEQLTLDWSNWPYQFEIGQVFSKLAVNEPNLKCIKFRKRQIQELHTARYGFGGKRYLVAKSLPRMFFSESYIEEAVQELDEAVRNENHIIYGKFPFKIIFEIGIFLFDRRREDKVPNWKNSIDFQIVFYEANKITVRLMENGKQITTEVELQVDGDFGDNIREAVEELWVQVGEPNEISRFDNNIINFSNHMV